MQPQTLAVTALDEAWAYAEKATKDLARDLPDTAVAAAATSTAWALSAVLASGAPVPVDAVIDLTEAGRVTAEHGGAPADPEELKAIALERARAHAEKASTYLGANAAQLARAAAEVSNAWGQLSLLADQLGR
ncbi:MAG: hypothetical protein AB7H43_13870 [Acidimicrobiia bacterium]